MGRQPFGLASPAAWLRGAGFQVALLDLSQSPLDEDAVRAADLIAFYLPMHTATRIAVRAIRKVRELNPAAHLCAYGLYAPLNWDLLRGLGVKNVIGGEFETGLRMLARRLAGQIPPQPRVPRLSLVKQQFVVPDRAGLPPLRKYARLLMPDGAERVTGYTEATRGCKHLCRHCPIVPVYEGAFRVVQRDVVLADIRQQVAAGAEHITFGDPDFFNGPTHSIELVEALHREFPALSYDVTIKAEHLLKHADLLATLRRTGCAFVTSAIESVDDRVLTLLDKGHTRADFYRLVETMRSAGLPLAPTVVAFTPWTTLDSYGEMLRAIAELGLVESVAPVQWTIRLLIPAGSRLLELAEVQSIIGEFDQQALCYRWANPDARVDALQRQIERLVEERSRAGDSRAAIFEKVWERVWRAGEKAGAAAQLPSFHLPARATIPYLNEPWYC